MARILVVDDDPAIRELIKDLLVMENHAVELACDGEEALAKAGGGGFDLVIIDRHMPRLSGIEAVRRLRATPAGKALKVIMCTAADTVGDVDDALSAGSDDYVAKPIDFARLTEKVTRFTAGAAPAPAGGLKGLMARLFRSRS